MIWRETGTITPKRRMCRTMRILWFILFLARTKQGNKYLKGENIIYSQFHRFELWILGSRWAHVAMQLVEEATHLVHRKKKPRKRLRSEIIFKRDTFIDIVCLISSHHLKVPKLSEIPHQLETKCSKPELMKDNSQPKRSVPSWTPMVRGYVIEQNPFCLSPRILHFFFY